MLHKETVERETFRLLRTLMKDTRLSDFTLVGGTALALYLGHRKSIDLDLFTGIPFDEKNLESYLTEKFEFDVDVSFKNSLIGYIRGIKVDLITLKYPNVEDPLTSKDGIRLCSIMDIAAMKLLAISDAGTRLKDFIDIAYLSTRISLSNMLNAYEIKYKTPERLRPIRSLTYFEDIDFTVPVEMMQGYFKKNDWGKIEKRLHEMLIRDKEVFHSPPLQD